LVLAPRQPWTCCVHAVPEVDGTRIEFRGDPHEPDSGVPRRTRLRVDAAPILAEPVRCGLADLERLAMHEPGDGPPFIAAGTPWFMALFGRDLLTTSLMSGIMGSWQARGALEALGRLQAHEDDPFRDAEPGKIPHELRIGELT